ncbi:MAG: von Willebrand factor type A domain-containing protein [Planctomycetales bacterium]|nr:von Willebrand factor type A domain-containing protein [Planctomycetales bacterium]
MSLFFPESDLPESDPSEAADAARLERQLRDVPLPDGLRKRLKAGRVPLGPALDAVVREVPVPVGLNDRLRAVLDDEAFDEELRDVPLPIDLLNDLRTIPYERSAWRPVRRMAVAASWMLLIGGGYLAALLGLLSELSANARRQESLSDVIVMDFGPLELVGSAPSLRNVSDPALIGDASVLITSTELPMDSRSLGAESSGGETELQPLEPAWLADAGAGPIQTLQTQFVSDWRPLENTVLLRVGPLGASGSSNGALPPLEVVPEPRPRGIQPPLSPPRLGAFDRTFFVTRGIFPPSYPGFDPRLSQLELPLIASTASWRRLRELIARGELPSPRDVRVEEFLAAWDYSWQRPEPGKIAVRTAAGPAPFFESADASPFSVRPSLIQIAALAGPLPRRANDSSVRVTIALDSSATMSWNGRWDRVRDGVFNWLDQLRPTDRVSVLAFGDEPQWRIAAAGGEDLAAVRDMLATTSPSGGSNLAEAVRAAVALALESLSETDRADVNSPRPPASHAAIRSRVVLVTDSHARLSDENFAKLQTMLRLAADAGVRLHICDVASGRPDERLGELVALGGGDYRRVDSADELHWQLCELTSERSGVVAADAKLRVRFNPEAVVAYRLVGHEPTLLTGLSAAAVEQPLRAGETAVSLFEVWLNENAEVDDVAWAEVHWLDPISGQPQQTPRQRVSRLQFATSVAEMSLSLQAAALLAETAEVLRHGYSFTVDGSRTFSAKPKPDSLAHVIDVARRMNPRLAEEPKFAELLRLLHDIDRRGIP